MKRASLLVLMVSLVCCALVQGQDKTQAAVDASDAWLKIIDGGNYAQSWDEASSAFKAAVTQKDWERQVKAVRDPLGAVVSRKMKGAQYTKSLPGAPDGQYVVIQYDTSFANKKSAVETVTPMLDKDGKWRISGYYVR